MMKKLPVSPVVALVTILSAGCCISQLPTKPTPRPTPDAGGSGWGSIIHIDFDGLIAQNATDPNNQPWRALLIDATTTNPPHVPTMTIPGVVDSTALSNAVGTTLGCASGCDVPLTGLGIQFVDDKGNTLQPAFGVSPDFRAVPRLQDASPGATFNLTADATSQFPPEPASGKPRRVAAYVELNGGTLSVVNEFGCLAHFSHEADNDSRAWTSTLRLTGWTPSTIVLQIKGPNTHYQWQSVVFAGSTAYLHVYVTNMQQYPTGASHFRLFEILAVPQITLDDVVTKMGCHNPLDSVPGCSNSQWP